MVAYSFYESDNRIMRYSDALAQAGHHVDVVALKTRGQVPQETIRGVRVYRIQTRVYPERTGKLAYLLRLGRFLLKSAAWLAVRHLAEPYDLVHVHSIPDFEVFAAIVPRALGCKVILDIHDIVPEFYCSKFGVRRGSLVFRLLVLVERWSIAFSHHVIIANHLWRDRLVGRSVARDKCTVVMNYPDGSIFRGSPRAPGRRAFVMMYPGTINYHQGLDLAVRAFHRVRDRMPAARFDIYGDGPDRPAIEGLVRTLGMSDRIRILEPMPMVDIAGVMADADLGVVPKRSDTFGDEAFSTKSLEFMMLGVPLLMSATTIDQHYFDGSVVQFFRSGDEEDLAAKMLALYADPAKRKSLAENARRFVQAYRWDRRQDEYFDIIRRLLRDRAVDGGLRRSRRGGALRWRPFTFYYYVKGIIPRPLQVVMRQAFVRLSCGATARHWPIHPGAGRAPADFPGWPGGRQFALVLRHDVESAEGCAQCPKVLEMERTLGLRSAFFLVPEGYQVPADLRQQIADAGGEVGVHGLKHDGKLYRSRALFAARAVSINRYLREWGATGFASPSAQHELDWLHELAIEHDLSTFDTDPFEPQPDAAHTIFPFLVRGPVGAGGFVELPYTLPQDFTLFVLMKERDTAIWKRKVDWVVARGGMVLVNTHPDYMRFPGETFRRFTYPSGFYAELLDYICSRYSGRYWHALPREVAAYWRSLPAAATGGLARGKRR